jgi:hypothetical protein
MKPWIIWDIERKEREKREIAEEAGRAVYAPPPPGWNERPLKKEEENDPYR